MSDVNIEVIENGDIEQCKDLCNELMAFQKSKARIDPHLFDGMNFETRMKKSYDNALRKNVALIKDQGRSVGYVFSTIDTITQAHKDAFPDWAPKTGTGFFPDWVEVPQKIGCLNNLYLRDSYQGTGLGKQLINHAIQWLESFPDVSLSFVYISNGNKAGLNFYLNNGFTLSHDVFGGFITAAYKKKI